MRVGVWLDVAVHEGAIECTPHVRGRLVLVNAKKERDDKYCRAVIPTISGTEE